MTTVLDILIEARKRIERPEAWTQFAYARTAGGNPVTPVSTHACAWCVSGAISLGGSSNDLPNRWAARDALLLAAGTGASTVPDWNDAKGRTHAEVLAAFDKAIEAAS